MATIPIVNTIDKRVGIISAFVTMLITLIVLMLLTYDMPNPLPVDKKVVTQQAELSEIELKELVVEGGASGGGGNPSNDPLDEPKPQTQQSITSNKPRPTSTPTGGQSNNTNAQNSNNPSSTSTQGNDPFGGGNSSQPGNGGPGFGNDPGGGGSTTGGGIGNGKGRKAIGSLDVQGIVIETNATIVYKLTVDKNGNVTGFSHYSAQTTTIDQVLINRIGNEIKQQIKFTPGSTLDYIRYPVTVKAT